MSKATKACITGCILFLLGYIVYSSMKLDQFKCEVCMEFRGKTDCRRAIGATKQDALRTAIETACDQLSSGMTDSMACSRTPPQSINCEKH